MKENTIWFFEGRIQKPRHTTAAIKRATKISKALKEIFKPQKKHVAIGWRKQKMGQQRISSVFGRPSPWLTKIIATTMARDGFQVDYSDTEESDFRICRMAAESPTKESTVFSADSDFIALSPPGSISQLIKIEKGGAMIMKKKDVLSSESMSDFQLMLAYCIAGCDNVNAHIKNVGWGRASKFARQSTITLESLDTLQTIPIKAGEQSVKIQLLDDIKR